MNRRHMQGYSLVELMVSMALGLIITAAATQLFLANHIAINFQRGMNDVQANGRFALDQIMRDIRLAGLDHAAAIGAVGGGTGTGSLSPLVLSATQMPGLTANSTAVSADDGQSAGISSSDQIVLQYLALANTEDCEGNAVAKDKYVVARYYIAQDTANNNVPSLMCDGGYHAASTATAPVGVGTAGVVLVNGVDSFQVLYGIDDGLNGKAQVSRYITATTYNALSGAKPPILSVRLGMYLRSQERAGDAAQSTNAVQVLDKSIAASAIPDDGLLRRLFVTTVSLRNVDLSRI